MARALSHLFPSRPCRGRTKSDMMGCPLVFWLFAFVRLALSCSQFSELRPRPRSSLPSPRAVLLARVPPSLPPVASVVVVGVTPRFCRFSPPSFLAQGGFRHKIDHQKRPWCGSPAQLCKTNKGEGEKHRRRKMVQNKSYCTRLPPAHAPSRMNPKESCTRLWYPCWRTSQQQQKYLARHCKEAEGV